MAFPTDKRGRRAPTPSALASLAPIPDGFRVLPDPLHGQPLLRIPARPADVRVMLERSYESAEAGEPTQDYLAIRCDQRRLSFAVTDGVGSSFLGDVAAQILAIQLAEWFAGGPGADEVTTALDRYLHQLSNDVAERVANWPLAESVPALMRAALDQQRSYGSEAMLVAGTVDLSGRRDATATMAWLGDTRLRVIMRDGQTLDHSGRTNDRWSSRLGPRGAVQSRTWQVADVARVVACTDGVISVLDSAIELSDAALQEAVQRQARRPGNDDMAMVDIGLAPRAMPPGDAPNPTLVAPAHRRAAAAACPGHAGRIGVAPIHPGGRSGRAGGGPGVARAGDRTNDRRGTWLDRAGPLSDSAARAAGTRTAVHSGGPCPGGDRTTRSDRVAARRARPRAELVAGAGRRFVRGRTLPREDLCPADALLGKRTHLRRAADGCATVRARAQLGKRRARTMGTGLRPHRASRRLGALVTNPYRPFDGDAWLGRDLPLADGPYQVLPETAFEVAEEMAFARQGRKARVFKLSGPDGSAYALKTFYRVFSLPEYADITQALAAFGDIDGLRTCRRRLVEPAEAAAIGEPGLAYAVLMPWIEGVSWAGVVEGRFPLSLPTCLGLAAQTASILAET